MNQNENDMDAGLVDTLIETGADKAPVDLSHISALCEKMMRVQGEKDRLELELKQKNQELRELSHDKLPALLEAAGMSMLALPDNGPKVELKTEMFINVPKARKKQVIAEVRKLNLEHLISNTVSIRFEKGDDAKADEVYLQLREQNLSAERIEDVNSTSLKAALKSRRQDGENDDLSLFGAYEETKVVIKQ